MLLLCYFHFFLTDEGFLKKFIDSTKSLSPDEKGERLESDEVWDFLSLVKGNHFGHRCGKQMFCHTLLPFKQIFYCDVTFFPVLETNYFLFYHRTSVKRMQLVLRKDKQRLEIWQLKVLVHEFWKTDWNMNCNKYLHWWLHYDKNQLQYSLILTFCLQTPSVDDRVDLHFVAIVHRDGFLYELGEWLTKWVFIELDNASFIELAF